MKKINSYLILFCLLFIVLERGLSFAFEHDNLRAPSGMFKSADKAELPNFFDDNYLFKTLNLILTSFGSFKDNYAITRLKGKHGYCLFTIHDKGRELLQEFGFDPNNFDNKAYALTLETEEVSSRILIHGLLFDNRVKKEVVFLDLSDFLFRNDVITKELLLSSLEMARKIFPGYESFEPWALNRIRTVPKNKKITVSLKKQFDNFDGTFEMLTLARLVTISEGVHYYKIWDGIFTPLDPDSVDFQEFLCEKAALFKGKTVSEIGAGTGINVLFALRFGAKSVIATEPNRLYYELAKWNIQFAKDTKQVSDNISVEIIHNSGLSSGLADVIIANFGSIRNPKQVAKLTVKFGKRLIDSYHLSEEDFMVLFEKLKKRLMENKQTVAICRILPIFEDGYVSQFFPRLIQDGIKAAELTPVEKKIVAIIRAMKFLEKSGLSWQQNSIPSEEITDLPGGDIFLLKKDVIRSDSSSNTLSLVKSKQAYKKHINSMLWSL